MDFVGRTPQLEAVLEALARESSVRIAASIEGLPGIGKTELALQLCGRLERAGGYRIFWFNAAEPDLTRQWSDVVARHLSVEHPDPRERAKLALRLVESLAEPTLVVLDNAERWSASEPWPRPQGRHIRWLVTTRMSRLGDRAFEHVELPVLDAASAAELLTRIAGPGIAHRSGFRDLVEHLGGYTIGVELAAAFLGRFPEVEPTEYLKALVAGKSDVLEEEVAAAHAVPGNARARAGAALGAPAAYRASCGRAGGRLRTGVRERAALGCVRPGPQAAGAAPRLSPDPE